MVEHANPALWEPESAGSLDLPWRAGTACVAGEPSARQDGYPTWGYTRIRGALNNLGHDIGRNTIKHILLEAGLQPAPERSKRTSWRSFLRAHWGAIAAMDFFTVEAVT